MGTSKFGVYHAQYGMDMSLCMILTISAVICTLLGCALLLCCIRVSTEREDRRRQNLACSVENESNASSTTPMLRARTGNRDDGDEV